MKELNISDELFSRFVDGKTTAEEDEQITQLLADNPELMDEFLAISKAAQLVDHKPLNEPDIAEAQRQVTATLQNRQLKPTRANRPARFWGKRFYLAAAAIAIILITSTVIVLLHHSPTSENTLAQQQGSSPTQSQEQTEQQPILLDTDHSSESGSQTVHPQNTGTDSHISPAATDEPSTEYIHSTKIDERHYADRQETNYLSVTKPAKSSYNINCKNLDRTFDFAWQAGNVQSLHFWVADANGKVLAETTDKTATQYPLSCRKAYPRQQLTWTLKVVHLDGTSETRSGIINIFYNLNEQ